MSQILIVNDSPVERRVLAGLLSVNTDWTIDFAADGAEALEKCHDREPDLVLTDFNMPRMDGMELLMKMKVDHASVPVIIATAEGSEELAVAALKQGAASYVPKTLMARDLVRVVDTVLNASKDRRQTDAIFTSLICQDLRFSFPTDRRLIGPAVNTLQDYGMRFGVFTEKERTRVGVALEEAFLNAIIHGNLEVSSKLRDADDGSFEKLIALRISQKPFCDRRVKVTAKFSPDEAKFIIRDQGKGFDVSKLPDPTDLEHLTRSHGRGVLLIRTFMDEVTYNSKGNQVTLVKRRKQPEVVAAPAARRLVSSK
jgi:CheY-like chemotaxis protein/anti-sigma regulatory factor (Ser/Thr protein kinase)